MSPSPPPVYDCLLHLCVSVAPWFTFLPSLRIIKLLKGELRKVKKYFYMYGKVLLFFLGWILAVLISSLPVFEQPPFFSENPAYQRLWSEALPLAATLLVTVIFTRLVERGRVTVPLAARLRKDILLGLLLGFVWFFAVLVVLIALDGFQLGEKTDVPSLWVWLLAAFLNVMMQEYLVRGYIFQFLRDKQNTIIAVIVTTLIFTALHGGAFEAGWVAVLNVVSTTVFISLLLLYTGSLLAPILVHFIWNALGGILFGCISLADDYPSLWQSSLQGGPLLTGGSAKLEGSIVVSAVNILLILIFSFLVYKKGCFAYPKGRKRKKA